MRGRLQLLAGRIVTGRAAHLLGGAIDLGVAVVVYRRALRRPASRRR